MDWRNRIGLYGSYFLGMAAIGFTLPYLPLYLGEKGSPTARSGSFRPWRRCRAWPSSRSDSGRTGSAGASRSWSPRSRWPPWRPCSCRGAHEAVWLGFLVILFAENGICRAVVESLSGAEAAALAPTGGVGAALGALRFWKPIGIVLVALLGSWMSEQYGVGAILLPLAVVQGLAVVAALLIHETSERGDQRTATTPDHGDSRSRTRCRR